MDKVDLRFKLLDEGNWLERDPTLEPFVELNKLTSEIRSPSAEDWANRFLRPRLSEQVPIEVQRLYEVARGMCLYGYFFYPLYAMAAGQTFLVAEAAIKGKVAKVGGPRLGFFPAVEWLAHRGDLSPEEPLGGTQLESFETSRPTLRTSG